MKIGIYFISTCLLGLMCNSIYCQTTDNNRWTIERAERHLSNRQDSTTWDRQMFDMDLKIMNNESPDPITYGVFPVPQYDLIGKGSFHGLGNLGFWGAENSRKEVNGKAILYNSFYVKRNELNKKYMGENPDEVFFHIIVLTDYIDTIDYEHCSTRIISRNHPDYVGEGAFITKNNKIDYVAFITADRNMYAIVNMRLFNLRYGKTILIAPQKDGSLRSMQIKSPQLSSEKIDVYTDALLRKKDVIDFFSAPGNI